MSKPNDDVKFIALEGQVQDKDVKLRKVEPPQTNFQDNIRQMNKRLLWWLLFGILIILIIGVIIGLIIYYAISRPSISS